MTQGYISYWQQEQYADWDLQLEHAWAMRVIYGMISEESLDGSVRAKLYMTKDECLRGKKWMQ